ncbi:MAG: glycosyltransferase [Deltaproteobacteria bacterium]|nr:glycosyltransferase [Deltaproteobacteria bacterium]
MAARSAGSRRSARILHIIETLGHGGAEAQLALSVRALDSTRFSSSVVQLGGESELARRIEAAGCPVFDLRVPRRRFAFPYAFARLSSLADRIRPDLIHTSLFEADVLGGLLGSRLGVPVVTTLCTVGGDVSQLQDNPNTNLAKHRAMTELWGLSLRSHDRAFIAISEAVADAAVENFRVDRRRVEVVYRAAPPRMPGGPRRSRSELGLEGDPALLTVGRLVPEKGHRYLIEAMHEIASARPRAALNLVGKGWLEPELLALVERLGLSSRVRFLGYRSDVSELMQAADFFVFPSLWEGLGVALVEAMSLGCVCIATNVGAMPEIIEHGRSGLLVPPRDPKALAEAVVDLASDPERSRAFQSSALARAKDRFDLRTVTARIEAIYERVLGPGGRGSDRIALFRNGS